MKNYIRPIAEVSKFDVADIITASGVLMKASDLAQDSAAAKLYELYEAGSEVDNAAVVTYEW